MAKCMFEFKTLRIRLMHELGKFHHLGKWNCFLEYNAVVFKSMRL